MSKVVRLSALESLLEDIQQDEAQVMIAMWRTAEEWHKEVENSEDD